MNNARLKAVRDAYCEQLGVQRLIPDEFVKSDFCFGLRIGITNYDLRRKFTLRVNPHQHLAISFHAEQVHFGESIDLRATSSKNLLADRHSIAGLCVS